MSRIDDVRELAEKVMGWNSGPEGSFQWRDISNQKCQRYNWNPFTCADDALEVVEAMRSQGWYAEAMSRDTYWVARMYSKDDDNDVLITEIGKTVPEAVCAAALAVIRKGAE